MRELTFFLTLTLASASTGSINVQREWVGSADGCGCECSCPSESCEAHQCPQGNVTFWCVCASAPPSIAPSQNDSLAQGPSYLRQGMEVKREHRGGRRKHFGSFLGVVGMVTAVAVIFGIKARNQSSKRAPHDSSGPPEAEAVVIAPESTDDTRGSLSPVTSWSKAPTAAPLRRVTCDGFFDTSGPSRYSNIQRRMMSSTLGPRNQSPFRGRKWTSR